MMDRETSLQGIDSLFEGDSSSARREEVTLEMKLRHLSSSDLARARKMVIEAPHGGYVLMKGKGEGGIAAILAPATEGEQITKLSYVNAKLETMAQGSYAKAALSGTAGGLVCCAAPCHWAMIPSVAGVVGLAYDWAASGVDLSKASSIDASPHHRYGAHMHSAPFGEAMRNNFVFYFDSICGSMHDLISDHYIVTGLILAGGATLVAGGIRSAARLGSAKGASSGFSGSFLVGKGEVELSSGMGIYTQDGIGEIFEEGRRMGVSQMQSEKATLEYVRRDEGIVGTLSYATESLRKKAQNIQDRNYQRICAELSSAYEGLAQLSDHKSRKIPSPEREVMASLAHHYRSLSAGASVFDIGKKARVFGEGLMRNHVVIA
jgi:hypothetical protein